MRRTISIVAVLGLIIVLASVSYVFYSQKRQEELVKKFGDQRAQVMSDYFYDVIGLTPATLKGKSDPANENCADYAEYLRLANLDTRQMTVIQLQRELSLYDTCQYGLTSEQYSLDSTLSEDISSLKGLSVSFGNTEDGKLATQIADDWRKIQILQGQKTDLIARSVERSQQYWQAELGYKNGSDGFAQRQATFERLNNEAQQDSQKVDDLKSQAKDLAVTEQDLWKEFMVKTGYKEATSTAN